MKFVVFVEGYTEKKVLSRYFKRWLDTRLNSDVGIQLVQFEGCNELMKNPPPKARRYVERSDVIAVIAIMDLYGLDIYPMDKRTVADRYLWAKAELERRVEHPKFHQFFAVHEIEAWLLSDPKLFSSEIRKELPQNIQKPETVDFTHPPAKLLDDLYQRIKRKSYKKITDGVNLFDRLDPNVAYTNCPYLKELFDEMLRLAREAGM